jgi:hypothetical protein
LRAQRRDFARDSSRLFAVLEFACIRRSVRIDVLPFRHVLLAACLLLAGCGSEEAGPTPAPAPKPPGPGTGRAVLADRAKVLDPAALGALTSVAPEGELTQLIFSSSSPTLRNVAAGDVLIVGVSEPTPEGGLFKVENVVSEGAGLVLSARPATLGDAFDELEISLDRPYRSRSRRGCSRWC